MCLTNEEWSFSCCCCFFFGHSIITQHRKVLLHCLSCPVIMVSVVVSGDTEEGGDGKEPPTNKCSSASSFVVSNINNKQCKNCSIRVQSKYTKITNRAKHFANRNEFPRHHQRHDMTLGRRMLCLCLWQCSGGLLTEEVKKWKPDKQNSTSIKSNSDFSFTLFLPLLPLMHCH